jgi:hypothetical protein
MAHICFILLSQKLHFPLEWWSFFYAMCQEVALSAQLSFAIRAGVKLEIYPKLSAILMADKL